MLKEKTICENYNSLNKMFDEYDSKISKNNNKHFFKKAINKIKEKGIQRLINMKNFSFNIYIMLLTISIILSIILIPLIAIGIYDFYINY